MDWHKSVVRITGPAITEKPQGTGFAVARTADAVLVVTCWHVVETLGADRLHIGERQCRLVSAPGDAHLDLAVLEVAALAGFEPLPMAGKGASRLAVAIFGYGPEGRALKGTLGQSTLWPHASGQDVHYWDYYLDVVEGVGAFERIKNGCSGSPVLDPVTGTVVAVVTHRVGEDKGFAIDVRGLIRVYPTAAAWLSASAVAIGEPEDEYSNEPGEALAKILDHQEQLGDIQRLLSDPGRDRHIVLVDAAGQSDWPEYLADHIYLDPWPDDHGSAPRHEPLRIDPRDDDGFWQALIRATPRGSEAPDPAAQREQVRRWVNAKGRLVLYAPVSVERHGRHLARLLRDAGAVLDALGAFNPGSRLLVVFACMPEGARVPFWWPLLDRLTLRRIRQLRRLPPLQQLSQVDIQLWHNSFPKCQRRQYDCDALKAELLRLFESGNLRIRYGQARDCLVGNPSGSGALSRARRRA